MRGLLFLFIFLAVIDVRLPSAKVEERSQEPSRIQNLSYGTKPYSPSLSSVTLREIESAFLKGDTLKVKGLAQSFINQSPEDDKDLDSVTYYLALSHLKEAEYKQARGLFKRLIKSDSDSQARVKSYLGLWETYEREGKYLEEIENIQKLLEENPKFDYLSCAYLKLSRAYLKLAKADEAKVYLEKIVKEFPKSLELAEAKEILKNEYPP